MHKANELNGKTIEQAILSDKDDKLVIAFTDGIRVTIKPSVNWSNPRLVSLDIKMRGPFRNVS